MEMRKRQRSKIQKVHSPLWKSEVMWSDAKCHGNFRVSDGPNIPSLVTVQVFSCIILFLFLQVKLVDGSGAPIANETVRISLQGGQETNYTTNEEGRAQFALNTSMLELESVGIRVSHGGKVMKWPAGMEGEYFWSFYYIYRSTQLLDSGCLCQPQRHYGGNSHATDQAAMWQLHLACIWFRLGNSNIGLEETSSSHIVRSAPRDHQPYLDKSVSRMHLTYS